MALLDKNTQSLQQTVDLRISIPELPKAGTFWMRNYPTHRNFAELYQDCVNHADVARERKTLEQVRASRHFWFNDIMLRRDALLTTLPIQSSQPGGGSQEISLILRRDYYQVHPANLLKTKSEHIYINAEAPAREIIAEVLVSEECPGCFNLHMHTGKHIAHDRSLADERCWPAWEDAPPSEFPTRARLLLRPRVSWLPYALYIVALAIGLLVGYHWLAAVLVRPPA